MLEDDGALRVIGRTSDTIITGGENVAPTEVEAVLEAHPAVAEAAAYGVADARWGEALHALVVLRAAVAEPDLRAHCTSPAAAHMVPKRIAVAPALPRTASGKLQRHLLAVDDATATA